MRKRGLLAAGVGSALILAALSLAMTAGAAKTASAGKKDQRSCYPNNEFQINSGDTEATLDDVQVNPEFEIEPGYSSSESTLVNGTVRANMHFVVVDGVTLKGWAKVTFIINGKKWRFESKCIAEAQTEADGTENGNDAINRFEAEFEGTVSGFPFSDKKQRAIASLHGYTLDSGPDAGKIVLFFGVEQGSTCDEYQGEIGSNNEENVGTTLGDLSADDTQAGRWGVPDRFDPSLNEPCADVIAD